MPLARSFFSPLLFLPNPQTLTLIRHLSSSLSTSTTASAGGEVSLYLRRARLINALRLRLHSHDPTKQFNLPSSPLLDSFVAVQVLRSAPSTDLALSFFRSLPFSHPSILHSLAKRLSLSKRIADLRPILHSLDARLSPMDRLRYLATAGDSPAALDVWSSIRTAAANRHPSTEAYNLVIGLYASKRSDSAAVETFQQMIADGANPNSRTYTVVMDHLIKSGNLDPAIEIFKLLPSMRIRRSSKQYNLLADELSRSDRFKELESLIKEMKSDGILAGRSMRESIAKLRSAGFTETTEDFASELCPNDKIEYVANEDANSDEEEEEEESEGGEITAVRLKPWMDPSALARALNGWYPPEVRTLESAGFIWTPRLVCKLLRAFKQPETAWHFFCWVAHQPGFTHDCQTLTRMISILARSNHAELVHRLLSKLESEQLRLPFSTLRLSIDFFGLSKNSDAAIKLYRRATSICDPLTQSNRIILCSSLLRTLVKCKRKHELMEMLEEMVGNGILIDLPTFSGLMQFFAEDGDLKSVHRLFGLLRQCGLEPDGYMYGVLIRGYCRNERSSLGLRLFGEMTGAGMVVDSRTKGLLMRSLWREGKLREAATVEERCEGMEARMPAVAPGHVWTVSEGDFGRVCEIYANCFNG